MRDNPVIRRWFKSLKGRGLLAALVPLILGAMTPYWPSLNLYNYGYNHGKSISALLLLI